MARQLQQVMGWPTGTTDRNVYILGAGFSAPAGAPLIYNFLDRSRALFDAPSKFLPPPEREHFQRVFDFRTRVEQARGKVIIDLDDIEQLFSLVEMSVGFDLRQRDTRTSTTYLIARTLEWATREYTHWDKLRIGAFQDARDWARQHRIEPDSFQVDNSIQDHEYISIDIFSYFAALAAGLLDNPWQGKARHDTVITFNYDLVLDHALYGLGVEPDYHHEVFDPGPAHLARRPLRFLVLKLHGSINWGVCPNCRAQLYIQSRKPGPMLSWFPQQLCANCKKQIYQPLLVPPTWDKHEHQDILQRVWTEAFEQMKSANRICVIGYSMPETDAFFKYLLTLALSESSRLSKLIVVDLGSSDVETRWKKMLDPLFQQRRFTYHPEGLVGFWGAKNSLNELGRGDGLADQTICLLGHPS